MRTPAASTMTRNVLCISQEDTLDNAHALMSAWNIRHLPVLEDGKLIGVLSDRDVLLRATVTESGVVHVPALLVTTVMSPHPVTCRPQSTVSYVAGLMVEYKIDCVPVTEPSGKLIGLVTSTDLLQLLHDREDPTRQVLPFDFRLSMGAAAA